jgi:hypothetical protein
MIYNYVLIRPVFPACWSLLNRVIVYDIALIKLNVR